MQILLENAYASITKEQLHLVLFFKLMVSGGFLLLADFQFLGTDLVVSGFKVRFLVISHL